MVSDFRLDSYDCRILELLQRNGRLSQAEIGRRVGLSPSAVAERIRVMEAEGVITAYVAIIDPAKVGLPVSAMIRVTCDGDRCRQFPGAAADFPELVECHRLTGDHSAVVRAVLPSIDALEGMADKIARFGKPSTALILSTSFAHRPLVIPAQAKKV